jgi:hypothetical protein
MCQAATACALIAGVCRRRRDWPRPGHLYDQLPPGVRDELERLNPKTEKGRRRYHNHRFLSGEIGNPHLEKQVAVVTALMRGASNWNQFIKGFNRNFRPDQGEQADMFDSIEDDVK